MASLLGGYGVTGSLHRFFGVLLFVTFGLHLGRVLERLYLRRQYSILWGPDSLVPQPRDLVQMAQHFKWFVGLGPRPQFDRFTYWEKFDYWAVFWGVNIIGTSGLMLWFPKFFSLIVPGWMFNLALLIHGEEALLALVFIFTFHFFNGHLRPEKFPMDTVIFTGRVSWEELEHERPGHAARLKELGEIEQLRVDMTPPWVARLGRTVGTIAVTLGLTMVVLTAYAILTGHL
jgi:cytochrome b subunit of formate dehydrogenase